MVASFIVRVVVFGVLLILAYISVQRLLWKKKKQNDQRAFHELNGTSEVTTVFNPEEFANRHNKISEKSS